MIFFSEPKKRSSYDNSWRIRLRIASSLFVQFKLKRLIILLRRHPDALPIGRAKSSRRTSLGGALFQRPLSRRVQTIQLGLSFWDSSSLLSSAHLCFKSSGQQPAEEWLECTNVM